MSHSIFYLYPSLWIALRQRLIDSQFSTPRSISEHFLMKFLFNYEGVCINKSVGGGVNKFHYPFMGGSPNSCIGQSLHLVTLREWSLFMALGGIPKLYSKRAPKGAATSDTNTRSCPPGLHKLVFLLNIPLKSCKIWLKSCIYNNQCI